MSAATSTQPKSIGTYVIYGALAGFTGGVLFGVLMGFMNMLEVIGSIVGVANPYMGLFVHMGISTVTGGLYGVIASRLSSSWTTALTAGLIYGVFWWVVGGLILTPLFLGTTDQIFALGTNQWLNLIGYVLYGIVTAFVFGSLERE